MINTTIIQNYGVTLYGNPNCLPIIKAVADFANGPGEIGLIESNPWVHYGSSSFTYHLSSPRTLIPMSPASAFLTPPCLRFPIPSPASTIFHLALAS